MKIGLVFDNRLRPETTGLYCRRALGRLVDLEHLWPSELEMIPTGLYDLFLFVDDGLDYAIPSNLRPSAAWAIDTHIDFERSVRRFGDVDSLFAAQKNGAAELSKAIGRRVEWLPLACDPAIHRPMRGVKVQYDLAFVGHLLGIQRQELLQLLPRNFPKSLFCQATFDDMANIYSSARLGFNCSVANDLNMRTFEIPAHQIPLLTNVLVDNGLEELFQVGKHLFTYGSTGELIDTLRKLLKNEHLCSQVAEAGYRHVLANHTYDHRMHHLLRCVQSASPQLQKSMNPTKPTAYYEFSRPDVQSLVPPTAQHILDIGCGAGRLGQELKQSRNLHITGIEQNARAAARAHGRLDIVLNKSIEQVTETEFCPTAFDTVILADVLEHLRDPAATLKKAHGWLKDEGSLIVSVPNSRHHSVISGLINGNWTYESAGLLDEDHVRCFTRRELEKLLYRCGFQTDALLTIPGNGYAQWEAAGRPGKVQVAGFHVGGLTTQEAEEFYTYQYLVRAVRRPKSTHGLTSIVIVTWNQLAYTQECVDSVLSRTDEPIELIFVDNGSTDGTLEFVHSIPNARVISNAENRGFAPAVNQGLKVCSGNQIVLLNNDCVVTTGWLDQLLTVLHDDPRNGLVGPVSNNVSGEQQIPVTYSELSSLDGFAWDRRTFRELITTDRLVGFCMLFRREVMDCIGLLDEQFKIGCFEDDDYCRRASKAGYRSIIATNAFVHHYGSVTFKAAGFDFHRIMQENEGRYNAKWKSANTSAVNDAGNEELDSQASVYCEMSSNALDRLLTRRVIRVSLCMIVRDNEDTIEACLDSIYPWVDEIIVVDTGSIDRTLEICQKYGTRIYSFPWCDDFSAARNASLSYAKGEWVFWMDSDDIMPDPQGRKLRELVYGNHECGVDGYVIQVHCPSDLAGEMTIVDHVKLFRNREDFRFEHRIHEQILPAIRRGGGSVAFTDIYVLHTGSHQSPDTRQRKLERDFRILKLDLERYPEHPFVLFNLGMTHEDASEFELAQMFLERSIAAAAPGESHLRKAWALLINCQKHLQDPNVAIESASEALRLFPNDKELLFRRAVLYQSSGQLEEAVEDYESVIAESVEKVFQSVDPGITTHKAQHNLALTLLELGRTEEAIMHWRSAIAANQQFVPAWDALGRAFASSQQWNQLRSLLKDMPLDTGFRSTRATLTALDLESRNEISTAVDVLDSFCREKEDSNCLDELCRLQTLQGDYERALTNLQRLFVVRPNEPTVMHNLGIALHLCNRSGEGKQILQECLQIDPTRVLTICQLASVFEAEDDWPHALEALESGLEHLPDNSQLQEAIMRLKTRMH